MANSDPRQIITPLVLVGLRLGVGEGLGLGNQVAISTRGVIIWQGVENGHNTSILAISCATPLQYLITLSMFENQREREREMFSKSHINRIFNILITVDLRLEDLLSILF